MKTKSRKTRSNPSGKNLKMNDEVYALRRKIMGFIYDAKKLLRQQGKELPRITIRITDGSHCQDHMGMAGLESCEIWVPKRSFIWKDAELRHMVFHEIVHAVTGFGHDEKCYLMHPVCKSRPVKSRTDKAFLKYF